MSLRQFGGNFQRSDRAMGLLDGKVAVITAAGSGMGKASAKVFAREGAKIVISDISGAQEQTAQEIGGGKNVVVMHCDVSEENQVAAQIDMAMSTFGKLDVMLNVAGLPYAGMIETLDEPEYKRGTDVMFKGVLWGTKHAIRAMKSKAGGVIINWSSLAGILPSPMSMVYSAVKAAVIQVTRSTAADFGRFNIRANAICPGMIATEGMGRMALEHLPSLASKNPLGHPGKGEDAGELAAFLASDRASYISGVAIALDGGWACVLHHDRWDSV
jgi:NAD(P)-dependent dehydrogenase (short-subunit alcohol dehydrogenase family)